VTGSSLMIVVVPLKRYTLTDLSDQKENGRFCKTSVNDGGTRAYSPAANIELKSVYGELTKKLTG